MSAVPKVEPEPSPDDPSADEGWALLEGLRRRLDDQAVQNRKTQQQVTQLAESIGALVEHQRKRTRGLNLNSFVAYLIFTLLCGAGFYFLYTTRASELVESRATARKERDAAVRRADEATTKLAAREQADQRSWEVYELLEAGKRADAMAKLETLRTLPLSRTEKAVLAARAHETRVMEVDAALKAATGAARSGRHVDAIASLEAALVGEPEGARNAKLRYYLGVAYAKSGQLEKAIPNLTIALAVEAEHEDVRFQLASALDRSGAYAKARAEYDRFATGHPVSSFAPFAMRRSATLARMPAVAPAAPAAAPGAKPATPPPGANPNGGAQLPDTTTKPAVPAAKAPGAKPVVPAAPSNDPLAPPPPPPPPPSTTGSAAQPLGMVPAVLSPRDLPPIAPSDPPSSSTPAPEPWPRPAPPERTPAPELVTPAPQPPRLPPSTSGDQLGAREAHGPALVAR